MDPQMVQYYPTNTTPISTTVLANHHQNLSGSAESTPRSASQAVLECWPDEPGQLAQVPGCAKMRLMCSYGGHIIPRPNDKSLCYVGGETRMVTVERNVSLSDMCDRLSRSLLDGRLGFGLKYQLPNEDLDSLISVSTDEDLENMAEEYERLSVCKARGDGRLRLFVFMGKPETAKTMGVLLDGMKTETWFVDALNCADVLNRGLSESAAMDDLLCLGSGVSHEQVNTTQLEQPKTPTHQEMHSIHTIMSDAPTVEATASSFNSSTSFPSMAHLPPVRIRADETGVGSTREPTLEEQLLSQLRVTPPFPTAILPTPAVSNTTNATGTLNRAVVSEDEKSEHVVSRKPPLPLPLLHVNPRFNLMSSSEFKYAAAYDFPSPDSVNSDSSMASTKSQVQPNNTIDSKTESSSPTPQDPNTYLHPQQQPQLIHYLPSPTHTAIPPYYPVYQPQNLSHPQFDQQQQYPSTMYYLPVTQTQPYNLSVQANEPTRPGGFMQVNPNPSQFHQQYVGYSATGQPIATYGNYGYAHDQQQQQQMSYTGQIFANNTGTGVTVAGSQYQTITATQATMIAEANMQLPTSDGST